MRVPTLTSDLKVRERFLPDRLAAEALAPRVGSGRVVFLGDSITNGDNNQTNQKENHNAYPTYAMLASQGRWLFLANKGVGGNLTSDMLARFQTDVVDLGAEVVVVMGGMNDSGFGYGMATYTANMTAIADAAEAAGILPVFCAITASTSGGSRQAFIVRYNEWLRRFCGRRGYMFIDTFALTADTAGALKAAYNSGDDVHPNTAGARAIGEHVAERLSTLFPGEVQGLAVSTIATDDLLAGSGLFLTDTSGVGTGWSIYNGTNPGGTSFSIVTDASVVGRMQRVKPSSAPAARVAVQRTAAAGTWLAGHRIAVSGIATTDGAAEVTVQIIFTGAPTGHTSYYIFRTAEAVTRGRFYWEMDIPAGVTQVTAMFGTLGATLGGIDVGQFSIKNLTTGSALL